MLVRCAKPSDFSYILDIRTCHYYSFPMKMSGEDNQFVLTCHCSYRLINNSYCTKLLVAIK